MVAAYRFRLIVRSYIALLLIASQSCWWHTGTVPSVVRTGMPTRRLPSALLCTCWRLRTVVRTGMPAVPGASPVHRCTRAGGSIRWYVPVCRRYLARPQCIIVRVLAAPYGGTYRYAGGTWRVSSASLYACWRLRTVVRTGMPAVPGASPVHRGTRAGGSIRWYVPVCRRYLARPQCIVVRMLAAPYGGTYRYAGGTWRVPSASWYACWLGVARYLKSRCDTYRDT